MKKYLSIFLSVMIFSCFCVPAFAYDWPPDNYDMPRTVITEDTASNALSGLFSTIRAIVNIGLLILGIILSVSLIGMIFDSIIPDKARTSRNRENRENRRSIIRYSSEAAENKMNRRL